MMEDISRVRDRMLALVDQINHHGLSGDIILAHIEDFVGVLGQISALQNIDIDREVLNSLRLITAMPTLNS